MNVSETLLGLLAGIDGMVPTPQSRVHVGGWVGSQCVPGH